jgi:hypothetical protein
MATERFHAKVAVQAGTASDEVLTKSQVDSLIADAKARANHTGTQTVSTLSDFTSAVNALIAAVIDGAPGALDTLNELAAALGDDPNFAATTASTIAALDTRLDLLEGASAGAVHKANVGDAVLSAFTVTHGLASTDLHVQVKEVATGQYVHPVVATTGTNTISVDFGSLVPTSAQFRVLIRTV